MAGEMPEGKIRFQGSEGISEVTHEKIQSVQGKGREKSGAIMLRPNTLCKILKLI